MEQQGLLHTPISKPAKAPVWACPRGTQGKPGGESNQSQKNKPASTIYRLTEAGAGLIFSYGNYQGVMSLDRGPWALPSGSIFALLTAAYSPGGSIFALLTAVLIARFARFLRPAYCPYWGQPGFGTRFASLLHPSFFRRWRGRGLRSP